MLEELRKKINIIDEELISLLNKRKQITDSIMSHKMKISIPIYDSNREMEIINSFLEKNHNLAICNI